MKLLLDQNISHRLVESLESDFTSVEHVRNLNLHRARDDEIWQLARDKQFTIVSKDSDFWERAVLEGPPPKVIWLQVGNCTTDEIKKLLKSNAQTIKTFGDNEEEALLTLD